MIIECTYCQGTGKKYGENHSDICPVCDGVGEVNVPSEHNECGYCNGTGHKYGRSHSDICPVCNGVGVTRIKDFE